MDDKTGKNLSREEELKAQGWSRNCLIGEPRLSEVVQLHKELGFEVLLEPVSPSSCDDQECTSCFESISETCKVVYVRKPSESS